MREADADSVKRIIDKLAPGKRSGEGPETGTEPEADHRILFVCMGNICRSPTAEGVFRHLVAERAPELKIYADSAGTHAYHVGESPDPRAQRAAERRGFSLSHIRARRVIAADFSRFDLILAMDTLNLTMLQNDCPEELQPRLELFLEYAPQLDRREVPDPYYGGGNGFEYVLDLVEEASLGLIEHLRARSTRRR